MDLKGMLNDGPAGQDARSSSEEQRARSSHTAAPRPPPPLATGSQPSTPSSYGPPSAQHPPPPYAHSLASPVRHHPYGSAPTPVKPTLQGPGGISQYGPATHHVQSPASAQHYRTYETPSATTPLARPPSHGYGFPAQGGSQHPGAANLQARSNSSMSATPPSTHSPYAPRQSPQSARSQGPGQSLPQHQYQHPQPSTPLGPPTFNRQPSGFQDAQSPFHQRNYSAASNGNVAGSPPHHTPGNMPYSESPTAYNRPPSQQRHSSDYPSRPSRERSESVSPKTKVPPRPPSMGSRHSSIPELYSRGVSVASNMNSIPADPQRHVMVPAQAPYAAAAQQHHHPPPETHPHLASEVSQRTPMTAAATPNSLASAPASEASSLSQPTRTPLMHQSSKMGMSHLLTPASEVPPAVNGPSALDAVSAVPANRIPDAAVHPSAVKSHSATPLEDRRQDAQDGRQPRPQVKSQDSASERMGFPGQPSATESKSILKRPADTEMPGAPPAKQRRTRKYAQPPVWARLSIHNLRSREQDAHMAHGHETGPSQQSRQANGGMSHQANGPANANGVVPEDRKPWMLNPPLDHDLINARQVLGPWEKTIKWNTPYPDILGTVQDWLFRQLDQLGDVARDPREGTVEIEAKFGTLIKDDDRLSLPVMNACVIDPHASSRMHLRFESTMTAAEHKHMNEFLNATIKDSKQYSGRIGMHYEHPFEIDSFHHLSSYGQSLLPKSIQRRQGTQRPRLRITYKDNRDGTRGDIKARIVKLPISNLHIFNPGHHYDCRISINLEVNFHRPDVDLDSLIDVDADRQNPPDVDRVKDRIQYKHLAYCIDLTKVQRRGLEPSHELELEVDSNALREQMALMREGKPNGFGDVVAGFLDNATFLMRTRPT